MELEPIDYSQSRLLPQALVALAGNNLLIVSR